MSEPSVERAKKVVDAPVLEAALRYAGKGTPVLPLQWATNGRCSCGEPNCESVAKHPLTKRGARDATADPKVIRTWWKRWPKADGGAA